MGAIGVLFWCRKRLQPLAKTLRLHARKGLGEPTSNEELVSCDLSDKAAVEALVEGCDGIVHMGGQATEAPRGRQFELQI